MHSLVSIAPVAAQPEGEVAVVTHHPLRRRTLLDAKRRWPLSIGVTYLALLGMLALNSCVNQKSAVADAPLSEDAIVRLADKMRGQGDMTMAADFYQRALERDPKNVPAYLGLASLYEQAGQSEQAGRYYLEAIRQDGRNANTRRAYARLLMTQGQYGAAAEQYQAALTRDGDDARARNGLGVALDQQNQHGAAQEQYRKVLTHDHDNMTALNNLGLSLLSSGDAPGAIKILAPAAESLKLTPSLRQNLALAYVMDGQDAMALGLLRRDLGAGEAGKILAQLRKQQRIGLKPMTQQGRAATPLPSATATVGEDAIPMAMPSMPVSAMPGTSNTAESTTAPRSKLNPLVAEMAATAAMPAGIVLAADGEPDADGQVAQFALPPDAAPQVQAVAIAKPIPVFKPAVKLVAVVKPTQVMPSQTNVTVQKAASVKTAHVDAQAVRTRLAKLRQEATLSSAVVTAPPPAESPPVQVAAVAAPSRATTNVTGMSSKLLFARSPVAMHSAPATATPAVLTGGGGTKVLVGPFATGAIADMQSGAIRSRFEEALPERPVLNVKINMTSSGTPQFNVHVLGFATSNDAQDFCAKLQRHDYPCAVQ